MNRPLVFLITAVFTITSVTTFAQNTIGLVNYIPSNSFDGFNLIYPSSQGNVYLINNCGEVVNVWEDSVHLPGASTYLANDGHIYITKSRGLQSNSAIHSGGAGEKVEKRDWNNNLLWSFSYNSPTFRMHHDIEVMPNGNILLIAWELISASEAFANGRDTNKLSDGKLWPCKIVEVEPIGTDSGNIVWEWRAWDHLVQDFDPSKANYGVVANNPGKINVNFGTQGNSRADWLHINSVNYNAELDQIILSVPKFDEIWIIDHSTTMQEAASSSGGLSGKGGKLLYRWGNIWAYDRGQNVDRILGFQHDAHWINLEISPNNPDRGKIGIFNNEPGIAYSEVIVIDPVFDTVNWRYPMTGNVWGPVTNYWSYTAPVPQDMYSVGLSGMQRLDNGNTLICSGRPGRLIEIDPTGNEVWKYIIPIKNGNPTTQGDTLPNNGNSVVNSVFRVQRYTASHPALVGKDLSPKGFIELNPDTTFCNSLTNIAAPDQVYTTAFSVYPNPADDYISIHGNSGNHIEKIELYDICGKQIFHSTYSGPENISIQLEHFDSGLYFIKVNDVNFHKIIIN